MGELVEMIAKALVDNPEAVAVNEVEGTQSVIIKSSSRGYGKNHRKTRKNCKSYKDSS